MTNRRIKYRASGVTGVRTWNKNGTLWTPADITTALWLDANDATTFTYSSTTGGSVALGQTTRNWSGMTPVGNDIYATVSGGDIYKQVSGTGNFVGLGLTARSWRSITTLGNDIYACAYGGDIYKQTDSTGNFVALGQFSRNWVGMTTLGNDVYACVYGGDIYKQVNGTGDFVALGQTTRNWQGMTTLGSDVYACVYGGDIYKQTGGTGNFVALGQTTRNWRNMMVLGSDVYATVNSGDIYKQTGGTGDFVALGHTARGWYGIATLGSDIYAGVYGGDIYKVVLPRVSQWNDKSGNAKHVSNATASQQPTYRASVLNGKPGVHFNLIDSQALVTTTGFNFDSTAFEIIHVAGANLQSGHGTLVPRFYFQPNKISYNAQDIITYSPSTSDKVTCWSFDGVSAHTLYENGTSKGTATQAVTTGFASDYAIGLADATYTSNTHCCEFIVLKTGTGSTNRIKLEGYLAHKWGLQSSLPAGHIYKDFPPYK